MKLHPTAREEFDTLVSAYRNLTYAAVESDSDKTSLEIQPVTGSQCYLYIEVDSDDNTLVLVDKTGTFDNIGYNTAVIASVIEDVLNGNVTKSARYCFRIEWYSKIRLSTSGLTHTSNMILLYPFGVFSKVKTIDFLGYPEL